MTLALSGAIALGAFLAGWALTRGSPVRTLAMPEAVRRLAQPRRMRAIARKLASVAG
jgi:hypothetical protein